MADALTYIQSVSVDHHRKKTFLFQIKKKTEKSLFLRTSNSSSHIFTQKLTFSSTFSSFSSVFSAELFYDTEECKHLHIFWETACFNQHKKKELKYCFLRNSFKTMCKIDRFLLPRPLLAQITIKSLKPKDISFTEH